MNAIWQMWSADLNNDLCDQIVTECEYYKPEDATIGSTNKTQDHQVRKSTIRWIEPSDVNSKFIHDLLMGYATQANRNAFGVEINQLHEIQYTIYNGEQEDFYDYHFDTFWANPRQTDRKISITIQLSDPDDYEGGEFYFEKQHNQPLQSQLQQRGTVLAFLSPIRHCVKPVTKGVRKSLVAWIEGPKWR
jgi:PKHD-type hydroxylase